MFTGIIDWNSVKIFWKNLWEFFKEFFRLWFAIFYAKWAKYFREFMETIALGIFSGIILLIPSEMFSAWVQCILKQFLRRIIWEFRLPSLRYCSNFLGDFSVFFLWYSFRNASSNFIRNSLGNFSKSSTHTFVRDYCRYSKNKKL